MENRRRYVTVIGGSQVSAQLALDAELIGRGLAEAGCVIVCGGRGGVMEAVCRGAATAGGMTIGILPGRSRDEANPFVDVAVPTGIGEARNSIVARTGEVVVAIGGQFGTLSEIAYALLYGKHVVAYRTWELSRHGRAPARYHRVDNPADALDYVKELLRTL